MEILIFIIGIFILYVVIQFAIDKSVTNTILRENNMLLREIRDLLKEKK